MSGTLNLVDDHLVLDFPYDAAQVAEIKKVPGSKWDKINRVWRAPMSSLDEIRAFADKHRFHIDEEVLLFDLPKREFQPTVPSGLTVKGEFVYLTFPFDPVKVRLVKKIPSVTWDHKTKSWKAPVSSLQNAIDWAGQFDLDISDDVAAMAAAEKSRMEIMKEASRKTFAEVDVSRLRGEPFPYQKAGIGYALSALDNTFAPRKGVIFGDEPGLGKTVQSIGVVEALDAYPALVICPASLKLNWQKELNRWTPHRSVQVLAGKTRVPLEADVAIINYDILPAWVDAFRDYKAIILDESHYVKSQTAARTKAAIKLSKKVIAPDAARILLTGTPVTNRPSELATQLDVVNRLNEFGGYMGYYRTFCAAFKDRWGHWQISGSSNLDVLNDRLRAACYVRRTKTQVLPELPAVIHSPVVVDTSVAGLREYKKAEADIIEYVMTRAAEIAIELGASPKSAAVRAKLRAEANQHLVRISVLRKLAAKAKMASVHEWIDARIDAGQKVVVAAHHREVVDEIAQKYGNLKIQGGMSLDEVEANKKAFQELPLEDAPVMVLSIQAAKTGHTLTAAQDVLFVELPWSPADVDQTYGRCHRIGQRGSVTATYMLAEGTIDQKIFDLIEEKRLVVDAVTEGESGSATASIAQQILGLFTGGEGVL